MAIGNSLGLGGMFDPNREMYQEGYGQQMSRYDYERMQYEEYMRHRQAQAMQQGIRPVEAPMSKEKQPNPVLLLLKG